MTHLFASLCLLLSREINVSTPRAVGKSKQKTHRRKTEQQQIMRMTRPRREREGYG